MGFFKLKTKNLFFIFLHGIFLVIFLRSVSDMAVGKGYNYRSFLKIAIFDYIKKYLYVLFRNVLGDVMNYTVLMHLYFRKKCMWLQLNLPSHTTFVVYLIVILTAPIK